MARTVQIWTWDFGYREVDLDDEPERLAPILQTILDGGLWQQFRKFPPETVRRLLPSLTLAPQTRRLLEIWIEEAAHHAA